MKKTTDHITAKSGIGTWEETLFVIMPNTIPYNVILSKKKPDERNGDVIAKVTIHCEGAQNEKQFQENLIETARPELIKQGIINKNDFLTTEKD